MLRQCGRLVHRLRMADWNIYFANLAEHFYEVYEATCGGKIPGWGDK